MVIWLLVNTALRSMGLSTMTLAGLQCLHHVLKGVSGPHYDKKVGFWKHLMAINGWKNDLVSGVDNASGIHGLRDEEGSTQWTDTGKEVQNLVHTLRLGSQLKINMFLCLSYLCITHVRRQNEFTLMGFEKSVSNGVLPLWNGTGIQWIQRIQLIWQITLAWIWGQF